MQGVALGKGATSQPLQLKYFDANNSPALGDSGLKALLGAFITQKKLFEVNLNHCEACPPCLVATAPGDTRAALSPVRAAQAGSATKGAWRW